MCSGAILLYGIPRFVIGENLTSRGTRIFSRSHGVKIELLREDTFIALTMENSQDMLLADSFHTTGCQKAASRGVTAERG